MPHKIIIIQYLKKKYIAAVTQIGQNDNNREQFRQNTENIL